MMKLTDMRNIGKEMEHKLKSVGISSPEALTELGSKDAFFRLKVQYPNVCLVHLYTLEGAVLDVDYNQLPDKVKQELKEYNESIR